MFQSDLEKCKIKYNGATQLELRNKCIMDRENKMAKEVNEIVD